MRRFGWRAAAKIAWRESRASSAKFLFVILAVSVGVAALTGVRGFSAAFEKMLLREARTLMAADLTVRIFGDATPSQVAAMDALASQGVQRTEITETLSMMSTGDGFDPVLVSAKAVDPSVYPFYGQVKLTPPARLRDLLDDRTVAISDDLPLRLKVNVGDTVRIGGKEYRIGAILGLEPDRMSGSLNVGPRVLMSQAGLKRANLLQTGSRAARRYLFRLPAEGPSVQRVRDYLRQSFPEALIVDFREVNPNIKRALDKATTYLSLVSLIALIVGALGVGMATHSHLQQKLDTIAIMKCIGARSGQILKIYVAQTLFLGAAGGLIGVMLGYGVQMLFPLLIARYFEAPRGITLDAASAFQGLSVGLLTTLLFTLPPLLGIRSVRPGLIFRRDMTETRLTWRDRWMRYQLSILTGGLILAGVAAIAAWLSDSWKAGLWFAGGLFGSLIALSGVAWLMLRGLRLFIRRAPWKLPPTWRHGIANLYRPGNHAEVVLVALGVGVMFTLTVYMIQKSVLEGVMSSAPPGMPNVFLINITEPEVSAVEALIRKQPGVEGPIEMIPSVSARLTRVDGVPLDRESRQGFERRLLRTLSISWAETAPNTVKVMEGQWWEPGLEEPAASVTVEAARALGIRIGSWLEWEVSGQPVQAKVVAIHRKEQVRLAANQEFVLNRFALRNAPTIYFSGVRVRPESVASFQRVCFEYFPTVTVINAADILAIVQEVVDQVALVVRFISVFAILAGAVILASSVAGTRFRRVREVVILKTLGAKRNRLAKIFSIEFLILGLTAGVMGSLLAMIFSGLLLTNLLDGSFVFDPLAAAIAVAATAVIANGAGWLASFRILRRKPLEVLREE